MAYTRTTWVDNTAPYIDAAHLNNIEVELVDLDSRDTFILKSADESVTSSTTLQADDALTRTLAAGTWLIDLSLIASGAAAGDLKVAWAFSGTTSAAYRAGHGPTTTTTSAINGAAATTVGVNRSAVAGDTAPTITASTSYGVDGTNWSFITERGVLVVVVAGVLTVQWAQDASSATATIVRAGSHLWCRKVA